MTSSTDGPVRVSTEGGGRGMPGKCGVGQMGLRGLISKHALAGALDGHE